MQISRSRGKLANFLGAFFYGVYFKFFRNLKTSKLSTKLNDIIADEFHKLYYYSPSRTWDNTFWMGVPAKKTPLDLWIYQEIIFELKPDIIVETGTANGGSALFLASMCDLVDNGKIITIDIEASEGRPQHDRIEYILGSSLSEEVVSKVKKVVERDHKVLVLLDSDHTKKHVLEEMNVYSEIVTKGSYLIVEDTNINGNPVLSGFGEGPNEAVMEFLSGNKKFIVDREKEKFFVTFNPQGYLKRVA